MITDREVLAELVGLKDLKRDIAASTVCAIDPEGYALVDRLTAEYEYRKPLAWAAARARLALPEASVAGVRAGPLKLDTTEQVFFYEQDHYYLSNFSAFDLMWKGYLYNTSEAAYHSEKFAEKDLRVRIMHAASAHEAFKLAEAHRDRRRKDWDAVKVGVMLDILRAKAKQHEYVRRKLLETGERELVENSWRDDYWGWGPNRDGQNMLGNLWMQVRSELRAAAPQQEQTP